MCFCPNQMKGCKKKSACVTFFGLIIQNILIKRETRGRSLSIKCQNTSIERTPPPSIFSTSNFRVFQGAWAVGRQRCTVWTGNYLLNLMSLISDRSNDINFSFLLWKIYKEVTSFASKNCLHSEQSKHFALRLLPLKQQHLLC